MVGGASKIRQDCPPFMLTETTGRIRAGVGPNIVGLQRRGFSAEVRSALKEAFRLLYREGLNRSQALERIKYEVDDLPEIRQLVQFYAESQRGFIDPAQPL
jgi:UDP-N-acetylglucosamine acyltransferase